MGTLPPASQQGGLAFGDEDDDDDEDSVRFTEHERICAKLGVKVDRANVDFDEYKEDPALPVQSLKYWKGMMACKTATQWRTKLVSLGMAKANVDGLKTAEEIQQAILKEWWTEEFEDEEDGDGDKAKKEAGSQGSPAPKRQKSCRG